MLLVEPDVRGRDKPPLKVMLAIISDKVLASNLVRLFQRETGYIVLVVEDGLQAQKVAKEIVPNFLLLDYHLQGTDGITLYVRLHMMNGFGETPALIINTPMVLENIWSTNNMVICLKEPVAHNELLASIEKLEASYQRHEQYL